MAGYIIQIPKTKEILKDHLKAVRVYLLDKLMSHQASAALPLGKGIDNHVDLEDRGDCILHSDENNRLYLKGIAERSIYTMLY